MRRRRKRTAAGATLFGDVVPQIRAPQRTHRVPVESRSEVWFAIDDAADEWITKDIEGNNLVAEMMGWLIARKLSVRVPEAAIVRDDGVTSWATRKIDGVHWSQDLDERVSPLDAAGIIVLDCLIMNEDRHPGNLMWAPARNGEGSLYAIDHDMAAIGNPSKYSDFGLTPPNREGLAPGFPLERASTAVEAFVEAAKALPVELLNAYARDSLEWVGSRHKAAALAEAVYNRCQAIDDIVARYLQTAGVRL